MKPKSFWIVCIAAATLVAGSARADSLVVGWDFSQYAGDSFLTIDGQNFVDTLAGNYSNFDPTGNAGAESAQFGTLYYNGDFGSSSFPVGTGTEPFIPTTQNLSSNVDAPVQQFGDNPFESFSILASEGQQFTQRLGMSANETVTIVFSADLAPIQAIGSDWMLSFGGRTFTGNADITIEVSTNGSDFAQVGVVTLDENDTPYTVALNAATSDQAWVRLELDASGGDPILDNVGISATVATPEPSAAALLLLGLAGLALRRRA